MLQNQTSAQSQNEREYKLIKSDLIRLGILNTVYLAGLLALYFINRQSHFLDRWTASLFKF